MLMLDFMRRNARSWGIKVALGIICLVFVFFMGGGGRLGAGGRPLAVVGDTPVTVTEYQLARQRNEAYFASQYGGQLTPEIRRALDIPGLTLRQLVEAAVLRQEADRIGLQVPDEAVRSAIQEIDSFHVDNTFSPTRYRDVLRAQGLNTGGFERSMREELLSNQLTGLIRLGAQASEEEAYQSYAERSRTVSLSYVAVPGADLEPEGDLDEEGLAAHFQESIENYRLPESVKVRYLAFTPDVFLDEVEPDDEQIEEYYELNKDSEFTTEEKVAARHILKKFAEDADDETRQAVRKTAEALLTRVKDGEDFAELATAESEDAGSAIKGGDLGYFGRGRMVEPFENSAFSLGVGQTSDLVESRFGFHIIHVYDRNEAGTSNLEDVRASIVSKLSRSAAADLAFDAAASDAAAAADGTSLDVLASERGIDIQSTPLLGKGDIVPGLGPQPALVDAALDLGTKGDVSEAVKVGDGYYILELAERRESYLPKLADARDDAVAAYRKHLGETAAQERADGLLERLRSGESLDQMAEAEELEVKETQPFAAGGEFIPGIGRLVGAKGLAFAGDDIDEPLSRTFVQRGDAYVLVRSELEEPNREGFAAEKQNLLDQLRVRKEQAALGDFVGRLKKNVEVVYDQVLVSQLVAGT